MKYPMRFGRILKQADILFADSQFPSIVSSGGVILARQSSDDYVRFRVPDTQCPPLPRPDSPSDDGQADVAEPGRWMVAGTPDTSEKWLLKQATDSIQLSYTVYDGDFTLEFEIRDLSVISGTVNGLYFDGIVVELYINDSNWARVGFGFQASNGIRGWGYQRAVAGSVATAIGPGTLNDEVFRARVSRVGSSWSATFWRTGDPNWTTPTSLGNIGTGSVRVTVRGLRFSQGSGMGWYSTRNVQGRVTYLSTLSGAPTSISISTPVIDLGQPIHAEPAVYPSVSLQWRASNTQFEPTANLPEWNNPSGEYRYWQVRASTDQVNTLIERIELGATLVGIFRVALAGVGWRLWHVGADSPYRPVEEAEAGVPRSVRVSDGDSVSWQGEGEVVVTRDK
jgi:hypothetical protein